MDRCKFYDCTVNGKPLATYGGASLLDFSIGETAVKPAVFQGVNRSSWNLLKNIYTMREIRLTIVFEAEDLRQAKLNRSALNGVLFEKAELFIPYDGFHYTVYCTGTGTETTIGIGEKTAQIKSEYTFSGLRHDELKTVSIKPNGSVYCLSTVPLTDCRLTATVGKSSASYTLGGATFQNVSAGDVLVFDGIDGKITKNGNNYAANVNWINFPALIPGTNVIPCADAVIVQYSPTYI